MNSANMGGMNAMGGPVGGAMPMNLVGGARPPMQPNDNQQQRSQLNTYIYEYFLRNDMFDCARSLLASGQPIKVDRDSPNSKRRDENANGLGDDGAEDSKDDLDSKRPDDLPAPEVPRECPESCFLYEWWCLFWDMFNAQRGKDNGRNVMQYVTHTQAQSRIRQHMQQNMLRGIRGGDMMPGAQYPHMHGELRQKAMQNNRNVPNQQLQMMQQQQQQQKQQQLQRDPSSSDQQQRVGSPGSAENAPSPSKRPRLDGGAPFNPQQQQQQMPNGRGQAQGIPQQFQNLPGGANAQQNGLAGYQAGLARQQQAQMPGQMAGKMPAPGPQNQGSPMMPQGQDGAAIQGYYNAGDMGANSAMRGIQAGGQANGGNHALQDYQMQLMLLEQQNKKRLMMARQEQDLIPGVMAPNGQPFPQGASPQGARSVNSPNPGEQLKRTPHMSNTGMPSPLPEGQTRGSPSAMSFNIPGGPIDPSMAQKYFSMNNGLDPNMVAGMPNGMRPPPSSHPAGGFNAQMTQQQVAMMQQQQQQQQQQRANNPNWQSGPNGQMIPGPNQGAPQQPIGQGTPQQRNMPPPSAIPANNAVNGRTQPSPPQQATAPPTPQQANKANPKKKNDTKDNKATKRATKKTSAANLNAGSTPNADAPQEPATPTPATPMTPVHPKSFAGQNQATAAQPVTNGQAPPATMNTNVAPSQPDPLANGFGMGNMDAGFGGYDLPDFTNGTNGDVLQDFDFDSFLHNDGEGVDNFDFNSFAPLDGNEIGAE